MKNIFLGFAVLASLFLGTLSVANADVRVECKQGDHKIWSADNTYTIGCIDGETWAKAFSNVYVGYGVQKGFVSVASGAIVRLKNGTMDTCPAWYPAGCVIDASLLAK